MASRPPAPAAHRWPSSRSWSTRRRRARPYRAPSSSADGRRASRTSKRGTRRTRARCSGQGTPDANGQFSFTVDTSSLSSGLDDLDDLGVGFATGWNAHERRERALFADDRDVERDRWGKRRGRNDEQRRIDRQRGLDGQPDGRHWGTSTRPPSGLDRPRQRRSAGRTSSW